MRSIILVSVVLGLLTAFLSPISAEAAERSLELKITTGVLPSGSQVDTEMNFTLTTSRGTLECRTYSEGPITNSSRVDAFTAETQHYECEGAGSPSEGSTGVSALTVGFKGISSSTLSVEVSWPAPYEACIYSGKLKGTNTLSGLLYANLAGKLKSSCHEHRAAVESNYWYTYAAFGEYEQLEDYVGTSG